MKQQQNARNLINLVCKRYTVTNPSVLYLNPTFETNRIRIQSLKNSDIDLTVEDKPDPTLENNPDIILHELRVGQGSPDPQPLKWRRIFFQDPYPWFAPATGGAARYQRQLEVLPRHRAHQHYGNLSGITRKNQLEIREHDNRKSTKCVINSIYNIIDFIKCIFNVPTIHWCAYFIELDSINVHRQTQGCIEGGGVE